jgi:hypothetical protein
MTRGTSPRAGGGKLLSIRALSIPAILLCSGLLSAIPAQAPDCSAALAAGARIQTLRCALVRSQLVNERAYVSKGTFAFDRCRGFRYDYQGAGGEYRFIYTGDTLYALNLSKKRYIRATAADTVRFHALYRSLHILESYLDLTKGDQAWRYRGCVDTSLYLSRESGAGLEEYILIDGATQRVKLIEYFEPGGTLIFSAAVGYRSPTRPAGDDFPCAIVIRRQGDAASQRDSLALSKVRINETIDAALFVCPDLRGWRALALPAPEITTLR